MFSSSSCWRKEASLPLKFTLLSLVLVQVTEVAASPFEDASFLSLSFLHFFPLEADGVKGIQSQCELNISKALKSW